MYDSLARYYDAMHQSVTADVAMIRRLARVHGQPIVELGCGSGRVLLPLARQGFQVTGADNSPRMLNRLRGKLAQEAEHVRRSVRLVEADIRRLSPNDFPMRHRLLLLTYNTMLHFPQAQVQQILSGAASIALPGAKLYIDVANPFLIAGTSYSDEPVLELSFYDRQSGETIEQWSSSRHDDAAQTLHVTWVLRSQERGEPVHEVDVAYHYLYPHQVELLLRQAGFRLQQMMGDYDEASLTEDSQRLLLLATRAAP